MSLSRQKGRNIWQAVVWNRITKKHRYVSTGTSDRKKAEQIEWQLRQAASGNIPGERVAKAIAELMGTTKPAPVMPIASVYADPPNRNHSYIKHARARWQAFAAWAESVGLSHVGQVTKAIADRYLVNVAAKCSAKTVANTRGDLRAAWGRAGIAGENPFAGRGFTEAGGKSDKGRAFTDAEIAAILKASSGEETGAVLAGLYTGLRYGDILRLRPDHIDGDLLRIEPSKTKRHGVTVVMPIHPRLGTWLERKVAAMGAEPDGAPVKRSRIYSSIYENRNLIFHELARREHSSYFRGWFADLLKRAGVTAAPGEYVGFHSLRHTFRTRLAAAGVGQDVAMRLCGHLSAAMSSRYNHDTESLRRAVEAIK